MFNRSLIGDTDVDDGCNIRDVGDYFDHFGNQDKLPKFRLPNQKKFYC